jgi:hypothetical protein
MKNLRDIAFRMIFLFFVVVVKISVAVQYKGNWHRQLPVKSDAVNVWATSWK